MRNCLLRSHRYWKVPGLGLGSPRKSKNGSVRVIVKDGVLQSKD